LQLEIETIAMEKITVCCNNCGWEPISKKLWQCTCGTKWDAFETLGKCPCCNKEWEYVQCVEDAGGCNSAAPLEHWYQGLNETVQHLVDEMQLKIIPSII
jgi:hypothetical protein